MSKEVGEYFRQVEDAWAERGLVAQPVPWGGDNIMAYDLETAPPYSKGKIEARLPMPGPVEAYVQVYESLSVVGTHIERDSYSYELIVEGARLENWHRHGRRRGASSDHERPHRHIGEEREVLGHSISHKDMLDSCFEALAGYRATDG